MVRRTTLLNNDKLSTAQISIIFFLIVWFLAPTDTSFNGHVLQAQAIAQGHFWIANLPNWIEHFSFQGRGYFIQRPGPALLMLPLVWLRGTVNQVNVCLVIGTLGVAAAWQLTQTDRLWLIAFFSLGTVYLYQVANGDSWGLSSTATIPFTFVALHQTLNRKSPFIAGLCAGAAALQRYEFIFAWPFYAILWRRAWWQFTLAAIPSGLFLLWYNYARFGNPFTSDMSLFVHVDPQAHSEQALQLKYIPTNLNVLLFMAPYLDGRFPYLHPHYGGQALMWTSPAFLSVLRVKELSLRILCLWLMAICVSIPCLMFYASGYVQFGARYYIQIYPFLFALLAIHAEESGLDQLDKLLICTSILFVVFGIWHIHYYSWGW